MSLPRYHLSKQNGVAMVYKHFSQPGETKVIQMRIYQFKLIKS